MADEQTLEVIREEYEKKLAEEREKHEQELAAQRNEYEQKLAQQKEEHKQDIRDLFAGRKEAPAPAPEKSDEDKTLDALRKRFKIKQGETE